MATRSAADMAAILGTHMPAQSSAPIAVETSALAAVEPAPVAPATVDTSDPVAAKAARKAARKAKKASQMER